MRKYLLLTICLLVAISLATPALAQTSDEILQDAQGEAVQVISTTALNVWSLVIGSLVVLVGIVTITALRLVHKSTPEWAHTAMIAVANKAITTLQEFANKTTTDIDNRITDTVRNVFDEFIDQLILDDDESDDELPKTPIQ